MGVILKVAGVEAPEGAKKIYRDALVNEGSLFIHDYSNRGTLSDFKLNEGAPANDLSMEISREIHGIDNSSKLKSALELTPELTPGKGIKIATIASNTVLDDDGFLLGNDLTDYFKTNQPPALIIFWARKLTTSTGKFFSCSNAGGRFLELMTTSTFSVFMANGTSGGVPIEFGTLYQVACEYQGNGLPLKRYVNGVYDGEGTTLPTDFSATVELPALVGSRDAAVPDVSLYRLLIYDLSKTEMTADEIVKKDWDYCNGIGEYAGLPTKRPFIDAL